MIKKLNKMRAEKGFTLAELLVVILIIAILATVAIVFFTGQTDNAKNQTANANLRSAYAAAQNLYLENGGNYGADATAAETAVVNAIESDTSLDAVTTGTPGDKQVLVDMTSATAGSLEATGATGAITQNLPN